jgi:hypothetical protein
MTTRRAGTNADFSVSLTPMNPARIVLTLALLCVLAVGNATQPSAPITLEGVLIIGEFYGPPNYGEGLGEDRIEHSLFLQLPAPPATQLADSNALAAFSREARQTYFVQVVIHDSQRSAAEHAIGRRVRVVGVLFEPLTAHHRTPLLIDVESLQPIDTWRW